MSGADAKLRRILAPALILLSVVGLLALAISLGARVDDETVLPMGTATASRDTYSRDAIGSLAPVQLGFVQRQLGLTTLGTLVPDSAPRPTSQPRTTVSTPASAPSTITGTGGSGLFASGGWVLQVAMVPSTNNARVGEQVRYRMIVRNTGTGEFRGRSFTLQWHTPTGTIGRNTLDQCEILPISLVQATCRIPRLSVSNGDDKAHESFNSAGLVSIRAGGQWMRDWYVTILPGSNGTALHNHAHLTVTIDGQPVTVGSGDVVVKVA